MAKDMTWKATAGVLSVATVSWIVLTITDHVYTPRSESEPFVLDSNPVIILTYQWCMVAYFCNLLFSLPKIFLEVDENKLVLHLLILYISLMSSVSYLLFWTGYSPILTDINSCLYVPQRWMLYCFTAPAILAILARISDYTIWQFAWVSFLFEIVLISGGVATVPWLSWNFKVFFYIVAVMPFPEILVRTWRMVLSAADAADPVSVKFLNFIATFTEVTWLIFPCIFFAAIGGFLPLHVSEPVWAFSDWLTKFVFSSSLMDANFYTLDQRRDMLRDLEAAHRNNVILQLSKAIEQKDDFLSSISHELRTPLNGVIGLSESLILGNLGKLPDKALHTIKIVSLSSKRLLQLINDILDAATLKQGSVVIKHEAVCVKHLVCDAVDLCSALVRKNVKLFNMVGSVPKIIGDNGRIAQILYNLLGNAVKFTAKGSISVMAGLSAEEDRLYISVTDTGEGIPADKLNSIFDAFAQVDMDTTRRHGGTGLGLHLVKELVKAHNGEITVDSCLGKGSTFTVFLPMTQNDSHHPPSSTHDPFPLESEPSTKWLPLKDGAAMETLVEEERPLRVPTISPPASKISNLSARDLVTRGKDGFEVMKPFYRAVHGGCMVLSVDDDPINQMVVDNLLTPAGYTVEQAMDGLEALEFLENCTALPDVILLDVMMPGMSGYETCTEIRRRLSTVMIPIIMVSAKASPEHVIKGLESGSVDYVKKPFHRQELLSRVSCQIRCREIFEAELATSKSGYLLKQAMPRHIRDKQTIGQMAVAENISGVTVLCVDVDGLWDSCEVGELVGILHQLSCAFEKLLPKYQVLHCEHISTTIMIVAGHDGAKDHTRRIISLAQDVIMIAERTKYWNKQNVHIRMGIHTGPGSAGAIGVEKPRYCVFGSTICVASRLQRSAFPHTVQVSEATMQAAPEAFVPYQQDLDVGVGTMPTHMMKVGDYEKALDAVATKHMVASTERNEVELQMAAMESDLLMYSDDLEESKAQLVQVQSELDACQDRVSLAQAKEMAAKAETRKAKEMLSKSNLMARVDIESVSEKPDTSNERLSELSLALTPNLATAYQSQADERLPELCLASSPNLANASQPACQSATQVQEVRPERSKARSASKWTSSSVPLYKLYSTSFMLSSEMPHKSSTSYSPVPQVVGGSVVETIKLVLGSASLQGLLSDLGLEQYLGVLEQNNLTLMTLPHMSGRDLANMGVSTVGAQRRIVEAAHQFQTLLDHAARMMLAINDRSSDS